jgi:hypothetical protein
MVQHCYQAGYAVAFMNRSTRVPHVCGREWCSVQGRVGACTVIIDWGACMQQHAASDACIQVYSCHSHLGRIAAMEGGLVGNGHIRSPHKANAPASTAQHVFLRQQKSFFMWIAHRRSALLSEKARCTEAKGVAAAYLHSLHNAHSICCLMPCILRGSFVR